MKYALNLSVRKRMTTKRTRRGEKNKTNRRSALAKRDFTFKKRNAISVLILRGGRNEKGIKRERTVSFFELTNTEFVILYRRTVEIRSEGGHITSFI